MQLGMRVSGCDGDSEGRSLRAQDEEEEEADDEDDEDDPAGPVAPR